MKKLVIISLLLTTLLCGCSKDEIASVDESELMEAIGNSSISDNNITYDDVINGDYTVEDVYVDYGYNPDNDDKGSYNDNVTVEVAESTGNKLHVTGASNKLKPTTEESTDEVVVKPRDKDEGKFDNILNDIDFPYAKRDLGFSKGFAINPRGEYETGPILQDSFMAYGPNNTTITFKEVNSKEGDIQYWKEETFTHIGFMRCCIAKPEGSIPYGSEFKEGYGLNNYRDILGTNIIMTGEGDYTVNENTGLQLLSDDKISSKFGNGYLIEVYNINTSMYTGYALYTNKDNRVISITATSPYYPSLKDIIMEFADTCVHLY